MMRATNFFRNCFRASLFELGNKNGKLIRKITARGLQGDVVYLG
jgi:hypothetical protein